MTEMSSYNGKVKWRYKTDLMQDSDRMLLNVCYTLYGKMMELVPLLLGNNENAEKLTWRDNEPDQNTLKYKGNMKKVKSEKQEVAILHTLDFLGLSVIMEITDLIALENRGGFKSRLGHVIIHCVLTGEGGFFQRQYGHILL